MVSAMWELTKSFGFEAAHAISGTTRGAASEEVHGHSFRAEIALRGKPHPATGMMVDLGRLEQRVAEIKKLLDHKFLNNVAGLEKPTLEHLAVFIFERARPAGDESAAELTRVTVFRDSCNEACSYFGP
jgi:6-pyruvoyltetrahydropterin/6-carboxytetrahydropterin synthase